MFKKIKAASVDEYMAAIPKDRKEIIKHLDSFIRKSAPKLKRHLAYNMLGYGSFHYKNYKNKIIDWPIIALANQKNYVSVYVCALDNGRYVAEKYKKELGKVSVGKSCIRFKKLADVNLPVLKKVIKQAAKNPGLTKPEK